MSVASDPRPLDLGGAELQVVDLGARDGPPVVLIPGLTDGLAPLFEPAGRQLLEHVPLPLERVRGIVLSYRDRLAPGVSTVTLATDVASALAALVDRPAVLVGHSLGGMVAQWVAATHPELVAGLVLSASTARTDASLRALLGRWDGWLVAGDFRAFQRDAIRASLAGPARSAALASLPTPRAPGAGAIARHLALSGAAAGHDATDQLDRIVAPGLVLFGGRDVVVDPDGSRALAARLATAELVAFDDLGHGFPEQAREAFQGHLTRFLDELGR